MRMRIFGIGIVALCLVACGANESKMPTPPLAEAQKETEVNFYKAALLNVQMGEGYLAQGQIARAKKKFLHALELEPRLPEGHTSIGFFYETVGDLEEAEAHYKKAISYGDGKGRFYNNYGTFLCRQSRYKEADKAFNNAIKDKAYINTAEVYENAGLCALKVPDVEKARGYLKTAIMRDPHRISAYLELAKLEFSKHNYVAAKENLDYFNELSREPTAPSLLLGIQLHKKLGDQKQAAVDAAKLKQLFPKSAQYRLYVESMLDE